MTRTFLVIEVETPLPEQGEYVRAEAERLLGNLLRQKGYVANVRATTLGTGSIAAELADEILRLRLMLEHKP
jgi:hypothetical protein